MSSQFTLPLQIPLSTSGDLLAGAKLYFYETATSTPQDTYSDYGLTTPNANPVVADANGVFPVIFLGRATRYRVTLKTSADVTFADYPVDDIGPDTASLLGAAQVASSNTLTGAYQKIQNAEPRLIIDETDAGTDKRLWDIDVQAGVLGVRTRTDADGSGKNILKATRGTTTAITSMEYGDSADNPSHTFNGALIGNSALNASVPRVYTGLVAYKATSTTRTSTTTFANDSALIFPLVASAVYLVRVGLNFYEASGGAAGAKFQLYYSGTGGSINLVLPYHGLVDAVASTGELFVGSSLAFSDVGTIASRIIAEGIYDTTTAGSLSLQWAQNSSSVNGTTLDYGSFLIVTRIG